MQKALLINSVAGFVINYNLNVKANIHSANGAWSPNKEDFTATQQPKAWAQGGCILQEKPGSAAFLVLIRKCVEISASRYWGWFDSFSPNWTYWSPHTVLFWNLAEVGSFGNAACSFWSCACAKDRSPSSTAAWVVRVESWEGADPGCWSSLTGDTKY